LFICTGIILILEGWNKLKGKEIFPNIWGYLGPKSRGMPRLFHNYFLSNSLQNEISFIFVQTSRISDSIRSISSEV
jgi:hypothetical protein